MQSKQPRYKLDLCGLHAECEANYARLMRLLPDFESVDCREFLLTGGDGEASIQVSLQITQRCPYTTMVTVSQKIALTAWVEPPCFEVRLYHDAGMAEVIEYSGQRRWSARYDYPNAEMHQQDEKHQLNRFLGEWLSHCVAVGYSPDNLELAEC